MKTRTRLAGSQTGVSLIFALLALVAMTVGAVALIRSVDTGILAIGNLSFKQSGVSAGARAAEQAVAYLEANIGTAGALDADVASLGYYATSLDTLDPTARSASEAKVLALVDWDDNGCKVNGKDVGPSACMKPSAEIEVNGDKARYIITRLCSLPLHFLNSSNNCATPMAPGFTAADSRAAADYGSPTQLGNQTYSPYFRIITRTVGPKGTLSYTETLVHF